MAKSKPPVQQRVKELRWVRAADLAPHESNWRQHPPYQRAALQAMLDDVGIANAVIAYENADGRLTLIDGHLRRDMLPDTVLPVLVLDVDETEARKLLLTLDPLAAMAQPDMDMLMSLLQQTEFQDQAVKDMLEGLVNGETAPLPNLYANTEAPEAQIDRAEELRVKWGTVLGQVWELPSRSAPGKAHRLVC